MIALIKKETETALDIVKKAKLPLRVRDLLVQMTNEIQNQMDQGEWDFAVRLSFYRHEFAKAFNNLDWYAPFLEIRKVRDKIKIMIGK